MNKNLSLEQMKLLISGVLQKIPKKLSEFENDLVLEQTPNPDWNQTDETQKDYIKNRPFYDEEVDNVIQTIVKNASFTPKKTDINDYYYCNVGISNQSNNFLWDDTSLDNLYLITYNGVDYYLKPQQFMKYTSVGRYLGNPNIYLSKYTDNDLPFFIHVGSYGTVEFFTRDTETFTLSIYEIDASNPKKLISHPIADKYIPSTVPNIFESSVGNLPLVDEVDENNKPIKWKSIDFSWDNLKDRPFYELEKENLTTYIENLTLTTSSYTASDNGTFVTLYNAYLNLGTNDAFFSNDSCLYKVKYNDVEYLLEKAENVKYLGNPNIRFSNEDDNGLPFYIGGGLYDNLAVYTRTKNETFTISLYKVDKEIIIQQLDEKYIPDTIARKDYVDSTSLTLPQSLTEEQKTQARANISKFDWKTFSDSSGSYTYAVDKNSVDYDIAQTITNTSGNGTLSALEDIVSWFSSTNAIITSPSLRLESIKGAVSNFEALLSGGAIVEKQLRYYHPDSVYNNEEPSIIITIGKEISSLYNTTHYIYMTSRDIITSFYYNSDTDSIGHWENHYRGVTDNLTLRGYAADAKTVGDELANKITSPSSASVGQIIEVEEVDEDKRPIKWKVVNKPLPDWNESDSNNANFIKNRTHFESVYSESDLIENPSVGITLMRELTQSLSYYSYDNIGDSDSAFLLTFPLNTINTASNSVLSLNFMLQNYSRTTKIDDVNYCCESLNKSNFKLYVITDLTTLTEEYQEKFSVKGIYLEVSEVVTDTLFQLISIKYELIGFTPISRRYIPDTIARKDELDKLSERINELEDKTETKENIELVDMTSYLLKKGGNVVATSSTNENRIVSEPVYANEGETYLFTCSANYGNALYVIYDMTGESIGQVVADATEKGSVLKEAKVIMPEGTYYFRLACNKDILADGYSAYKIAESADASTIPTPLKDKKWVVVGDSLTEKNNRTAKNYHDYIAEETGITVVNMGVGGTGYKNGEDEYNAFYQRVLNIPEDADIITIFGSGNDRNLELGFASDSDTDTVCGCINTTIDIIHQVAPAAWLGIITPTPWMNFPPYETDNKMAKLSKLLVEICERRSIPCLDLYHCSGLRPWNEAFREIAYSKDDGDGTHPDETGHAMIYPQIRSFLLGGASNSNAIAISELATEISDLKENQPTAGSGVTTAQANSLWAVLQKSAFAEQLTDEELNAFKTAWGITSESGGEEEETPTDKPLSSISATYTGGEVTVGTALTDLTGITVTAIYSDGSTANVTGYILSGEIAEGSNTITVSYDGLTTTFTVVGVAETDEPVTDETVFYRLASTPRVCNADLYEDTGFIVNSGEETEIWAKDWTITTTYSTDKSHGYYLWGVNGTDSSLLKFDGLGQYKAPVLTFANAANHLGYPDIDVTGIETKIVITHSATTKVIYVYFVLNNELVTKTYSTNLDIFNSELYNGKMYVGGIDSANFIGTLSEFTIYNVVKSASEIAEYLGV